MGNCDGMGWYTRQSAQRRQCEKARRGNECNQKAGCHILMCEAQRKMAQGSAQMQIWKERLQIHRYVNTKLSEHIAALKSWNLSMLRCPSEITIWHDLIRGGECQAQQARVEQAG